MSEMAEQQQVENPAPHQQPTFAIIKQTKSRWWEVRDPADELVCLTVYRRGAREVVRRLTTQ
ncbi:MAG: hypothetical protein KY464_12430 [Gemmatimonadetes bacterium]|nr:hypothetical protein [Gemmatimonadota bacterium]